MCTPDNGFIEDFLDEYQKYECLWNPYHVGFDDCFARTEALTKIVEALHTDITTQDCLRLLKNIREKYAKEQTKILVSHRGNPGEKCQPRWMKIVEEMLEKVVSDEEHVTSCTQNQSATWNQNPNLKSLFRHTIPSRKRKSAAKFKAEVKKRERQRESESRINSLCRQTICSNSKTRNWPFIKFTGDCKKRKRVGRNRKKRNYCSELNCKPLQVRSCNNVQGTMDRDCYKNISDTRGTYNV
ncbi:hypothetical protein QAD02_022591 [Eretmocerus hayati]|uniref:Uncharacterized protein n=1 Tax=Eretmocerus hayati TaxID=131215 RepID=A0ACC2PTN7_9HYME|nr:hypothetical protein QAD02_022591 [Eretmocerus hayati]